MNFNLKKMLLCLTILLSTNIFAANVENANIAELAFHRLERLVLLKKIDYSYQSKYLELEFINLGVPESEEIQYKAIFKQSANSNNESSSLTLNMNTNGKTLTHEESFVDDSNTALDFPDRDPVTISENSLHFVQEEEAKGNLEINPFFRSLKYMIIEQEVINNVTLARVTILSSETDQKLKVYLGMDGVYSHHVIE